MPDQDMMGMSGVKTPYFQRSGDETRFNKLADEIEGDRKNRKSDSMIPDVPEYDANTHINMWGDHAKLFAGALGAAALIMGGRANGARGAISALTGAMKGMQAGQEALAAQKLQEYKLGLDATQKQFTDALNRYKAVRDEENKDIDQKMLELGILGKADQNNLMADVKVYGDMIQRINALDKHAADLAKAKRDLSTRYALYIGQKQPEDVKIYEHYKADEKAAGREPDDLMTFLTGASYAQYKTAQKGKTGSSWRTGGTPENIPEAVKSWGPKAKGVFSEMRSMPANKKFTDQQLIDFITKPGTDGKPKINTAL